ncbi:MAG: YIP1 family protein [Oscillospiraceae bacterium]
MKRFIRDLKYSFYILSHPSNGFYEMRFENRGSLPVCFSLLALAVVAFVCNAFYSGFIFNTENVREQNVFREIANLLIPVILWCVSNWSITVLMDGEGRFRDIFMTVCYASLPFTITAFVSLAMSHWMISGEAGFIGMVTSIGVGYTALLLFMGTLTIHQFTVIKTIATTIITIACMVFIVFLAVLFAGMFDKLFDYITGIITEIRLRV